MKKSTLKILFGIIFPTLLLFSCDSDQNSDLVEDKDQQQQVRFEIKPDTEISAEFTGNTAVINGVGKKEYLVTTEKSDVVSVPSLIKESDIENTVLYPGSILRGESFMKGNYDPLVLSNPFKEVTLFLTIGGLKSGEKFSSSVLPKGSAIFQALSELRTINSSYFPLDYVPANYSYESTIINNQESFVKATSVHAKANFAKLVSASFGYDNSKTIKENKQYILVKLVQNVYSAGIDPKFQKDWVEGDISTKEAGKYEPVYISSVDFGRVAYILVESNMTENEVTKMVKSSIDIGIGQIGGSANTMYNNNLKKLFNEDKVKVSVLGGNAKQIITDYDSFMKYLKLESSASSLIGSSAPISYTVRRLKDNTQVEIVNQYKDIKKEFR